MKRKFLFYSLLGSLLVASGIVIGQCPQSDTEPCNGYCVPVWGSGSGIDHYVCVLPIGAVEKDCTIGGKKKATVLISEP